MPGPVRSGRAWRAGAGGAGTGGSLAVWLLFHSIRTELLSDGDLQLLFLVLPYFSDMFVELDSIELN